jgi:hypothetical protein
MMGARMFVHSPLPFPALAGRKGKRGGGFSGILAATEYEKPDPCSKHDPAATRRKKAPTVQAQVYHTLPSATLRSCPHTGGAPMRPQLHRAPGGVR